MNIHAEKRLIDRLPQRSVADSGFAHSTMIETLRQLPLHHIEGIWKFPATGSEVAIVRSNPDINNPTASVNLYHIILFTSDSRAIRPGTIMGFITPSSTQGEYDARIYTSSVGSTLIMPKTFALTLAENDTSLRFKQKKSTFSINLWRLLPYLWRYTIHPNTSTDTQTDGCIRIFPEPPVPREPIYL